MLRGSTDYMERCNATVLLEKSNAGTMTLFDVVQCYRPDCGIDSYAPKQCLNLGNYWDPERWCWCSGPQGHSIPNTLSRNMQPNECGKHLLPILSVFHTLNKFFNTTNGFCIFSSASYK